MPAFPSRKRVAVISSIREPWPGSTTTRRKSAGILKWHCSISEVKSPVKLLPLKCAAPGEEVLDRSWVEQAAYREERIAAFEREIRDHDFRSLHVQGIVEEIAGSKNVEDEVRHEALRRIAVVQEHLGTGRDED